MRIASSVDIRMWPCIVNKTAFITTMQADGLTPRRPLSPLMRKECRSMNTMSDLTIVIPTKNEASLIPRLLHSLANQDYPKMSNTKVLVADAGSTDGTPEVVKLFDDCLNISVIPGGLPSFGR